MLTFPLCLVIFIELAHRSVCILFQLRRSVDLDAVGFLWCRLCDGPGTPTATNS